MSNEAHRETTPPQPTVIDLVQRGTDRFHDQQAEARLRLRSTAPEGR